MRQLSLAIKKAMNPRLIWSFNSRIGVCPTSSVLVCTLTRYIERNIIHRSPWSGMSRDAIPKCDACVTFGSCSMEHGLLQKPRTIDLSLITTLHERRLAMYQYTFLWYVTLNFLQTLQSSNGDGWRGLSSMRATIDICATGIAFAFFASENDRVAPGASEKCGLYPQKMSHVLWVI
jgi:hypothetical protein